MIGSSGSIQNQNSFLRRRILYASGPGDIVAHTRDSLSGKPPTYQTIIPFTDQFLAWTHGTGAETFFVTSCARRDKLTAGGDRYENRPKPSISSKSGLSYHIGAVLYGLGLVSTAIRSRADVAIFDSGSTHWIVLSLLALFRIPVIAVLHNSLWPKGYPPQGRAQRLLSRLDGLFFRRFAAATICVSPECERQVRAAAEKPRGPIYQCRAQYREGFLSRVEPAGAPPFERFHVLYLGRIEKQKGVFFILDLAEHLERELPGRFAWRFAGAGSAAESLRQEITARNLGSIVGFPGHLQSEQGALDTFSWAQALIVPTTSQFVEGLAMTAVEGILTGRPVVLSSVVPAAEVLGNATIVADTEDVESFARAFRGLLLNPGEYQAHQQATRAVQAQFYDQSVGLGNILGRAIEELGIPGEKVTA